MSDTSDIHTHCHIIVCDLYLNILTQRRPEIVHVGRVNDHWSAQLHHDLLRGQPVVVARGRAHDRHDAPAGRVGHRLHIVIAYRGCKRQSQRRR
jgi:hypothetical protein